MWQAFWGRIWWLSETLHVPLGRIAPWVFGQMIGCKGQCLGVDRYVREGIVPTEVRALHNTPVPIERCPCCKAEPFEPWLRGQVQRDRYPWWARVLPIRWRVRFKRPYCSLICTKCKSLIGHESPGQTDMIYELLRELHKA